MVSRSPFRSIGRLALIVICLGLVLVLALFVLPIYLDITAFRGPVEEILTEIVEAPVTVGQVELNLSLWPTLRFSGIEVQGSGREEAPLFTRIHSTEVRLSLLPLLRKELRIKDLGAADLDLHLHRPEGEVGNWPEWRGLAYEVTELSGIDIQKVTIFLDDHDLGTADAFIENLQGNITRDQPLELELQGTLESLPLSLNVGGPTLADLSLKASDFPLNVDLAFSDLRLSLSGSASREPAGTNWLLEVEAASTDWQFFQVLEDFKVPVKGGFDLAARVSISDTTVQLSDLRGKIGPTAIHGALSLESDSDRPHVSGRVSLGHLDLQPWMHRSGDSRSESATPLPFELLTLIDAGIHLTVQTISGFETEINDLSTSIDLADGNLTLPLQLQLASLPLDASVQLNQDGDNPEILAEITAEQVDFDQLRSLAEISENLAGSFGQIKVTASTSGRSVGALVANLDAQVEVSNANLSIASDSGERSFEIDLGRARIDHRTGQPLTMTATGVFLDEGFSLDLETGSLDSLTDTDTWPVRLALRGSGAMIDLGGEVVRQTEGIDLDIDFLLAGDSLGDLTAWVGFPPEADLAYRLGGHLTTQKGEHSLQLTESAVGRSRFLGTLSWDVDREEVPLEADLHAFALDLQQLQGLADPITNLDTEEDVIGFDLPILPSGVVFGDAEISLTVDRLYRNPMDLTDIQASLDFQQGQLERSPFSFRYDANEFDGEIELDLRGETPRFVLAVAGSAKNLREILSQEDLATDSPLTANQLELSIAAEGASIRQIVKSADIAGKIIDVRWQIALPESEESLDLRLGELDIIGPKGEPIVLESEGFLGEEPLHLRITIREFKRPQATHGLSMPFRLRAELASTEVELDGEFSLPITAGEFDLDLVLSGESLSDLSAVANQDLPDLGPYRLAGRLVVADDLYALQDFDLTLGESDLQGSLEYHQVDGRPSFDAMLLSQRTRSQDFLPPQQPVDAQDGGPPTQQRTLADFDAAEISLDALTGFDASVGLEIREFDTGGGPFEHVTGALELDRGELLLLMQRPQSDDKMAQIAAHVEPFDGGGIDADLHVQWERQPYGLLADILNPGVAQGSWSLNMGLQTHGASFDELLANLGGHFDFTDYPVDFNATILDLWGGGLVNSLMPVFKITEQSRINCTVGRFVVQDGVFKPETLIIDTTRSRVRGRGYVDLPNNTMKLRLKPRPKNRNLVNLAIPVKIRGPVADPSIRFTTSGIAVTAFRLSLWVYTVWVDLLRKPLPNDGSDICLDPPPRH